MSDSTTKQQMDPESDRLHVPANPPAEFSVSLGFMGYDPKAEIGFYHHFTRMHENLDLWEGVLVVFQRGGALLAHRVLGAHGTTDKADSGPLSFEVIEPLKKWRLRLDGSAIRCTTREAASGLIEHGAQAQLKVDLTFDGLVEPFSMGDKAMAGQAWGSSELEQAGQFTGEITLEGQRIALEFKGVRFHTSGPRNCETLDREAWTFGFFPSGRAFLACDAWQDPDRHLQFGFVIDSGKLHRATPKQVPPLQNAEGSPRSVVIDVSSAAVGDMHIEGEALEAMALTLRAPIGLPLGCDWARPRNTILVECPAKFHWNGETGYGWIERFNRIQRLTRPNTMSSK